MKEINFSFKIFFGEAMLFIKKNNLFIFFLIFTLSYGIKVDAMEDNSGEAIPGAIPHAQGRAANDDYFPNLPRNPLQYGFVHFNEGSIRLRPSINFVTDSPHEFSIEGIKKAAEKGILSAIGETTSSLLSHILIKIIFGGASTLKSMFPSKPSQEELLKHLMLIQEQNIIKKQQAENEIKIKGKIIKMLKEQYEDSKDSSKTAEEKREREILRQKLNIANEEYVNTSLAYLLATRRNNSQHSFEEEEEATTAA